MNEILFILQVITVICFLFAALILGKNALISVVCLQGVMANLCVVKQMNLFGLNVTCSDIFIVGSFLGLNLLQEYFGEEIVKKTIWISFFTTIFYLIMSQFQICYVPNIYDLNHASFSSILGFMPRITLASVFTCLCAQKFDYWLFSQLKTIFASKYFVIRNMCSIICSQFLDTIVFSFLGLYGIVGSISNVICISFCIKMIVIFLSVPFLGLSKKIIKKYYKFLGAQKLCFSNKGLDEKKEKNINLGS